MAKAQEAFPRIFLLLDENARRIFQQPDGPWLTGFRVKPVDLPFDWSSEDKRFVIVNSLSQVLFGPFIQTRPLVYSPNGEMFFRKEPLTPEVFLSPCRWLMEFAPAGDYPIRHGIHWLEASGLLDEAESGFRQLMVGGMAFNRLCQKLEKINANLETGFPIYGPIEDEIGLPEEDDTYEDWLSYFYDTRDPLILEGLADSDDRD